MIHIRALIEVAKHQTSNVSCIEIDSNKAIVVYKNASNVSQARLLEWSENGKVTILPT